MLRREGVRGSDLGRPGNGGTSVCLFLWWLSLGNRMPTCSLRPAHASADRLGDELGVRVGAGAVGTQGGSGRV